MLIHSEKESEEEPVNFDNLCLICYDNMDDDSNTVTLKCKHKFHYSCILMTYKSMSNKRQCPYCRGDGGYLTLLPGRLPQKNIHAEYNIQGNYQIQYIEGKCKYILKRGKNAGCQCTFNIKTESGLCTRHHKLLESKKNENANEN